MFEPDPIEESPQTRSVALAPSNSELSGSPNKTQKSTPDRVSKIMPCDRETDLYRQLVSTKTEVTKLTFQIKKKDEMIELEKSVTMDLMKQLEEKDKIIEELAQQLCQAEYQLSQCCSNSESQPSGPVETTHNTHEDKDKPKLIMNEQRKSPSLTEDAKFWQVDEEEVVVMEDKILGRGAWGYVAEGRYRKTRVAIKCVYPEIMQGGTLDRIKREINTMAQVRHPNLLLFIAAIIDQTKGPKIIMEPMDTSLRRAYEEKRITNNQKKMKVLKDVACALHYLHTHKPREIIHRDVSSANVLLEALADNQWKAKLSDFGSANFLRYAITMGEGSMVYAAPEMIPPSIGSDAPQPCQTTKVDVYSFGVLLCEVTTSQFPYPEVYKHVLSQVECEFPTIYSLITSCTNHQPESRPSMDQVIDKLSCD